MKIKSLITFSISMLLAFASKSQDWDKLDLNERKQVDNFNTPLEAFSVDEFQSALTINRFDVSDLQLDSIVVNRFIDNQYQIDYKYQYEYDRTGKVKSRLYSNYSNNEIVSMEAREYAFSKDSSIFEYTDIRMEQTGYTSKRKRRKTILDNQEEEISFIGYDDWDDVNDKPITFWYPTDKYLTTNNDDGDVISFQRLYWKQAHNWTPEKNYGRWTLNSQRIFSYTDDGKIELSISTSASSEGLMVPSSMTSYSYQENKETIINSTYYEDIDYWQAIDKYEDEYDLNGNLIQSIRSENQDWLDGNRPRGVDSLEWSPRYKGDYILDANGEREESRYFYYVGGYYWFWNSYVKYLRDEDGFAFSQSYSRELGDENFRKNNPNYAYRRDTTFNYGNNSLTIIGYSHDEVWSVDQVEKRYYSEPTKLSFFDVVKVYPNPSTDYISFDLDGINSYLHITIYDLKGNPLQSEYANISSQIDISQLSAGTYFYKMVYDNESVTGRIIKK